MRRSRRTAATAATRTRRSTARWSQPMSTARASPTGSAPRRRTAPWWSIADGSFTYTPSAGLQRRRQLHLHGERRRGRLQRRHRQPHHRGGERRTAARSRRRRLDSPLNTFCDVFSGVPVPISDPDVAIADPDSATLASATIHLLVPSPGDLLSVNGAAASRDQRIGLRSRHRHAHAQRPSLARRLSDRHPSGRIRHQRCLSAIPDD